MKKYMLVDMSNILYAAFFANRNESDDVLLGMCHQSGLMTMQYLSRKYNPDEIVAVFDSHSWRKDYTKYVAVSHKPYKGTRRQNITPKEAKQFEIFDEHLRIFYEYLRDNTSLLVLKRNMLESDDLIAGFVDMHPNDNHIIISADKDFIQLLSNPNVTLIEPRKETKRSLLDWNMDAKFFMFEKCLRGDAGDNVQSSYPRLRRNKIEEAYNDEYARTNLMEHTFSVEVVDEDASDTDNRIMKTYNYKTKELFDENVILMDLREQPPEIKKMIKSTIIAAKHAKRSFNLMAFVKFCRKYNLERIINYPDNITKMLGTGTNNSLILR